MRLFIAVDIPLHIKTSIKGLQDDLKKSGADVKWIRQESMHITLKFLGETRQDSLKHMEELLSDKISVVTPFKVNICGLGAFPEIERPKVIWIGIKDADGRIKNLASNVDETMSGMGFEREKRPFSPHVTIGRTRSGVYIHKLVSLLKENTQVGYGEMIIDRLRIIQSHLSPKGAVYECMSEIVMHQT